MNQDNDTIYLFPISENEVGGQPRSRSPTEQQILVEKGDALTSKATLAMLCHGHLTPAGEEATLLIVDFRFLTERNKERFRHARMKLVFRDAEGEAVSCPIIHRIAPEDSFSIEPGVDVWKITQTARLSLGGGAAGATANAEAETQTEREKKVKHSILLTGKKKLQPGGFLGETLAVWSLDEDPVDRMGIPTVLRTAVLLKRPPGRSFKFEAQIEAEVNWMARPFFGSREQVIPLEDIEVDPKDPRHVVASGDEWLSEWVKDASDKGKWSSLGKLNLQNELVLVINEKLMANK